MEETRSLENYEQIFKSECSFERIREHFRRKFILGVLSQSECLNILEIGCGLNPLFTNLDSFQQFHVVEPIESFAHNARQLAFNDPRIHIHQSRLEDLSQPENLNLDWIIVGSVLHEVEDADAFVSRLRGLAMSATSILFITPNAKSFHNLLAKEMGLIKSEFELSELAQRLQRRRTFDLASLGSFLEGRGLTIVRKGSFFFKPFADSQLEKLREIGFLTDAMIEGFYSISDVYPDLGSEIFVHAKLQ